jgi:hypothetical protein
LLGDFVQYFAKDPSLHQLAVGIVHTVLDQQVKTIYRVLSTGRNDTSLAVLQLLISLTLVPRSSAPDLLYRLVVSGFNVYPKLLSRKEATRDKEISAQSKNRKAQASPTIRSSSVHLVLAILRHGNTATKENLLANRVVMSPFVRFLPLDSDAVVFSVLEVLELYVLGDKALSRASRSVFFNTEQCLFRIASLHEQKSDELESLKLSEKVRHFVMDVCIRPGNGICFEDRGWYPRHMATSEESELSDVFIYNHILYRLISQLRPIEIQFHRELIIKILEVCPELRAPYLSKLYNPGDPALTFTYISWIALWTEIVQLPLPTTLENTSSLPDEPPPTETILANNFPQFVSKNYLSTALKNDSTLVRYYVCQLLYAILERMETLYLRYLAGGPKWHIQWDEISERVAGILPDPSAFQSLCFSGHRFLSHCGSKTLLLYVQAFTYRNANMKLDMKSMLAALETDWDMADSLSLIYGINLLNIIDQLADIDWWSKQGILIAYYPDYRHQEVPDWHAP